MIKFLHGYDAKLWEGYKKHDLVREGDGIRFMQNFLTPDEFRFNNLAQKGGKLYNLIKETKCPLYIDRLQGGAIIYDYNFDDELLDEYRNILGDKFLGFQMHEWLSNYRSDLRKCKNLTDEEWCEENIIAAVKEAFPCRNIFLESMLPHEIVQYGKPKNAKQFYDNMTDIYKKRVAKYKDLVPCEPSYIMFPFEAENGAKLIFTEIGRCDYRGLILIVSFARAIAKAYGIKWGAYYEPWGGDPFSVCTYYPNDKNDWWCENPDDFPFRPYGPNGGSSRSLQWRVYLYSYLCGAEYISEEWGAYNTFADEDCNTLSEYGIVKKRFVDFLKKYPDVGEKLAPVAVVISNNMKPYVVADSFYECGDEYDTLCGYPVTKEESENLYFVRSNLRKIYHNQTEMLGNETEGFINSNIPDAVDMLNYGDGKALENYQYIVDLTNEAELSQKYKNLILADEVESTLKKILPCRVDGGLHYLINHKIGGGYYLTIFNNSGIVRTVERGEEKLAEAKTTVKISMNEGFEANTLTLLEGDGILEQKDGVYYATLEAGGYMFMEF